MRTLSPPISHAVAEALACAALGDTSTSVLLDLRAADGVAMVSDLAASLVAVRADTIDARARAAASLDDLNDNLLVAMLEARSDPVRALDRALREDGRDSYPSFAVDAVVADCASRLALDRLAGERLARVLDALDEGIEGPGRDHAWVLLARRLTADAAMRLAARAGDQHDTTTWVNIVTGLDISSFDRLWVLCSIDSAFLQAVKVDDRTEVTRLDQRSTQTLRSIAAEALLYASVDDKPETLGRWRWSDPHELRRGLLRLGEVLYSGPVARLFEHPRPSPVELFAIGAAERLPIADALVETADGTVRSLRRLRPLHTPLSTDGRAKAARGHHRLYLRGDDVRSRRPHHRCEVDSTTLPQLLRQFEGGALIVHAHGLDARESAPSTAATPSEISAHVVDVSRFEPGKLDLTGWGVALAACGSGRIGADGALLRDGIVATMLERGATWVLASPWLLLDHDDTVTFVEMFIDAVFEGVHPAAALADTQHRWETAGGHAVFRLPWRVFT